jgi:hypothetical protein
LYHAPEEIEVKSALKRLKLHKFRYIKPGTELLFTERFNVLLGRNGTGKTTLLDLISTVLRSDFSSLRDEEFDIEYEYTHENGSGSVRVANALKPPATSRGIRERPRHQARVNVVLQRTGSEGDHGYEIEVDGVVTRWRPRGGGGAWEESAIVDIFEGSLHELLAESIPLPDYKALTILIELSRIGEWTYRFDESLDVFDSITAAARSPRSGRPPGISFDGRFDATQNMRSYRSTFVPPRICSRAA